MRILVLNGSPHTNGATSDMVSAFSIGAMEAGHGRFRLSDLLFHAFGTAAGCNPPDLLDRYSEEKAILEDGTDVTETVRKAENWLIEHSF